MRYTEVGGMRLSVIGLGTWQFGSREWGYGDAYANGEAARIVRRALDLGVNLVDTAEIYAFGRSELIVGRAIADRRAEVFLATKLYPILPIAPVVRWRAARSAARLGVEGIDLYQIHAPNPAVPLSSTMRGMAAVQQSGLVRHLGVSNFPLAAWQRADRAASNGVVSNQLRYSLAVRGIERDTLPWAQANDRLVIAYSPLAQGLLSGRYDATNVPADVRAKNPLFLPASLRDAAELLAGLREVAARHGVTSAQVALAWVVRRPNVVAIPGASSVKQLEENVAAADLTLSDEDDALLTQLSDRFEPAADKAAVRRHSWRKRMRR